MKKILLSLSLCFMAMVAAAQTYTEALSVTVNGNKSDQGKKEIQVERNADGTCTFILPNFVMADSTSEVPVGTIRLENVQMTPAAAGDSIKTKQDLEILPGDQEGIDPSGWLGPMLGAVPIDLKGVMTNNQLSAQIDIDFVALGMVIEVTIGETTETGIDQAVTTRPASSAVYNLNGVRVANNWNNNLPKGVYVVNGKKVIK